MRGKQPFVMLHTSLVEMLTPEEIQAVIAHELGHLKCEHGVYLTMANVLVLAANLLPAWGTVLAQSLQDQMLQWLRCAEFSCDRAALLAVQDPKVVMSVLMKLAGGSPTIAPQLNLDAFIDQAKAYDSVIKDSLGEVLQAAQTAQLSHPVPVIRAREIDRWASSAQYQTIIDKGQTDQGKKLGWINW
jgi:Zn-dependent protease with chaperone function